MLSEYRRIIGNYLRLMAGFLIGLLTVRQLLHYGSDIFNIYTVVTVGAGIGIILRELLRIGLTPHLSRVWAGRDAEGGAQVFQQVFGQTMIYAAIACVGGAALMVSLALAIPLFNIETQNIAAAQIFVGARTVTLVVTVILSPLLTMLLVLQHFGRVNLLMTLERVADFIAVLVPLVALAPGAEGSHALIVFAIASAVLVCSIYLFAALRLVRSYPLLRPCWRWAQRATQRQILVSLGWTLGLVLSFNLYLRFDTLFINAHFGAGATIAFGLAVQLIGMIRQLTAGIVHGLDAVVAKFHFLPTDDRNSSNTTDYEKILAFSNYLQTIISGSAVFLLVFWLDELLFLWVGGRVPDPSVLTLARDIVLVMLLGVAAVALSDGWANSMNGTGKKYLYVRYTALLAGTNVLLLFVLGGLGAATPITIAVVYSGLLIIGHMGFIPRIYAHETGGKTRKLFVPILRGMPVPVLAAGASMLLHSQLKALSPIAGLTINTALVIVLATIDVALFLRSYDRI